MFRTISLLALLLLLVVSSGWSQNTSQQLAAMKESKSIHQVEWEAFRNKEVPQQIPPFLGKPRALVPKAAKPSREVFGYLPYWVYSSYPSLNYNLLTTIAYFGVDIDENGNLVNLHHWPASGLIDMAHANGVRVVLTVILFDRDKISALLSNPTNRSRLITNLVNQVKNAGADGVTIDFEGVSGTQRSNLTTFMTELTDAFHSEIPGSYVTIFTPAIDWSNAFDYLNLATVTDGLIMQGYDYHWSTSPTAGPVAPLTGGPTWGTYCVTWTVDDYLTKTFSNNSKLILSVPFYGLEWPTVDDKVPSSTTDRATSVFYSTAYSRAQQYGRLWDAESQTPWYKYNDGKWHQGWYDDSLSLSLKFDLVNNRDLKGIAIWALSYDGTRQELQGAISDAFGSTAPPLRPTHLRVTNIGNGEVKVEVKPASGATAYRLYTSTDGTMFDNGRDFPSAAMEVSGLNRDRVYYFKVTAVNGNGESNPTEVLAVKPTAGVANVLIVNGFDRTSGTVNTFDFVKRFAPSLLKLGYSFNSCANEAIEDGNILLTDYPVVLWISGEEGTVDESFSAVEQSKIAQYLEQGGNLFVSGSEIGYDLVAKGNNNDKAFYRDYLKAEYVMDRVPTYTTTGLGGGIFTGLSNLTFDDGNHGTYNVDYPDGIRPASGAVQNLQYKGFDPAVYGGAGIQYEGTFGSSSTPGKLVYLAVGFETFYPASTRDTLLTRIMEFFAVPTGLGDSGENGVVAGNFRLLQNYPNPFNPSTTIAFDLNNPLPETVRLTVYDLLGKEVVTLVNRQLPAGHYEFQWDGRDRQGHPVPSGVYLYRLQVGKQTQTRKMSLVR